jgi:short-subunit dehydrogenase
MCTIQQVLPSMRAKNAGCIINIGSRAGTVNAPFATAYFSSKAALLRVTACLQLEQEMDGIDGVSLYCIHPGGVRTHSHTDPSSPSLITSSPTTRPYDPSFS